MALLFFVLVVHAFVVSSTHSHRRVRTEAQPVVSGTTAYDAETNNARDAGSDASCFSCRLQRSFVFDAQQSASLEPNLLPKPLRVELSRLEQSSYGPYLLLSDRAPPRS